MAPVPSEKRTRLRALYVHECVGLEAAAEHLEISERTALRWKAAAKKEGDDWDKARNASMLAGEGAEAVSRMLLEQFLTMMQSTLEAIKKDVDMKPGDKVDAMSSLADAYAKTMRGVQRSAPELNRLAVAMEVMQHLVKFVQTKAPKQAGALLEVLEPFGEHLAAIYG